MNLRLILIVAAGMLTSCSKPAEVEWVPKEGVSIITTRDAKTLCSSVDIGKARFFVGPSDEDATIWLFVPPETFIHYANLAVGEPLALQLNGLTLATFPTREMASSFPPAIPVPNRRNADGIWLSDTILKRKDAGVSR